MFNCIVHSWSSGPPSWGLSAGGLTTLPGKKPDVTETESIDIDTTQTRGTLDGAVTHFWVSTCRNSKANKIMSQSSNQATD